MGEDTSMMNRSRRWLRRDLTVRLDRYACAARGWLV